MRSGRVLEKSFYFYLRSNRDGAFTLYNNAGTCILCTKIINASGLNANALKVHKHENVFDFFLPKLKTYMTLMGN